MSEPTVEVPVVFTSAVYAFSIDASGDILHDGVNVGHTTPEVMARIFGDLPPMSINNKEI